LPDLETEAVVFRDRSLSGRVFQYVFLDATHCKAQADHRMMFQAVGVATRVAADAHREMRGLSRRQ
jgi:transposase-like protein